MSSKFMRGSSLLMGDNTIPGVRIPEDLKKLLPKIFQAVRDFGCDFYPTVVQMLTYDEMSEVASYGGFPVRYPHWKWGMEYEEMQRGYEHGMHRIYEMVVNTNPCYIYCMDSNTLVDNVTVVAHALGHNDFFKNNVFFTPTSQNMMNQLANHGTRIRKYMQRWGREKVTEFLDHVIRIETLIDPAKAWEKRRVKDVIITDTRKYNHPHRLNVKEGHDHMEEYINPKSWIGKQRQKIERAEVAESIGIFAQPTKDILGFVRDNAPLKPWQADIVAMLYNESMYFSPQRSTKTINEGWASYIDHNIMCNMAFCGLGQESPDCGIIEYAKHKMGVLGGKYSMNPYKLGYSLLSEIEDRWNKGRFGSEFENCTDIVEREKWDQKLGLGRQKIFEVRKFYDDVGLLMEFFDADFVNKYEFFEWKRYPNGEYKIESRDTKKIKKRLIARHLNGGLPEIHLVDANHKGKGYLFLQHDWDGRELYPSYVVPVLQSLQFLWGNEVYLATKNKNGEELVYCAYGHDDEGDVMVVSRQEYDADDHDGGRKAG
jgi:stage V sporulation protein R